jgi:hypothetical protein
MLKQLLQLLKDLASSRQTGRRLASRRRDYRPRLEGLENRVVPTTYY